MTSVIARAAGGGLAGTDAMLRLLGLGAVLALAVVLAGLGSTTTANAQNIANPIAYFAGLDKITGRLTRFDVYIDETVQFGALQMTPRACYTRPPTEAQRTTVFVEIDEVGLNGSVDRIFTGWMFADAPALNAVDHAVYDVWLVRCKQNSEVAPPEQDEGAPESGENAEASDGQ